MLGSVIDKSAIRCMKQAPPSRINYRNTDMTLQFALFLQLEIYNNVSAAIHNSTRAGGNVSLLLLMKFEKKRIRSQGPVK